MSGHLYSGVEISKNIYGLLTVLTSAPQDILKTNAYGSGVTVATPSVAGTPNFDGTIRSAPLIVSANDVVYPSVNL